MSLPREIEEELFQKVAKFIVDHDLIEWTMPFIKSYSRSDMFGTLAFGVVAPWTAIIGPDMFNFAHIMSIAPRENSKRLIEYIRKLEEKKVKDENTDTISKSRIRSFINYFLGKKVF